MVELPFYVSLLLLSQRRGHKKFAQKLFYDEVVAVNERVSLNDFATLLLCAFTFIL